MRAADGLPPATAASEPTPVARVAAFRSARRRWRAAVLGVALGALAVPILAACGSSSGRPDAGGAAISAACAAVSAALSDGPDPGADPVGYAEAQVKPLRAIHTSDHALRTAIGTLAAAYARVFASNGASPAAGQAVAAAAVKVSAICPGATS